MYHIKPDKRSQTTAVLITDAFKKCLLKKEYEQITITDIQRESTVSRSTFYRLFDCMDDVVAYLCSKTFDIISAEIQHCGYQNFHDIALLFARNWMQQEDLLQLTVKIHREDILYNCHMNYFDKIRQIVTDMTQNDTFSAYHISVLCSVMVGTLLTWIKEGRQKSPEELVTCMMTVLGDFYHLMHDGVKEND